MFCKYCHYEFYIPEDTLGAKIHCPNCTGTLKVEDRQLFFSCPECGGALEISLWMIGSVSSCPHCSRESVLSLGEESGKYFPDSPKQSAMLKTASFKAGEIIGKYRVIRCLGIGGMGEVYLVEHTLLNHRCALKLLRQDIAKDDPETRARLLREARLASQIQHKNLIAVLDAELDEKSSNSYIVMEYVDGVSIEHILADGPMLEECALEVISEVAEALKAASEHKITHRDIKPANIMLSRTGEVKVADLGIAKVESDGKQNMTLTMDNAVLGTPNYASPEQLRSSHQVDCRADIYSLGATLYHMLTGKRPFEAESVFGVMANVLEKDLPLAHEINPEVSDKTSALIARMMAKKRDDRPADFAELLKELKSGKKSSIAAPAFVKHLKEFFGKKRIRSIISTVIVVIIAGILCKLIFKSSPENKTYAKNSPAPRAVTVAHERNRRSFVSEPKRNVSASDDKRIERSTTPEKNVPTVQPSVNVPVAPAAEKSSSETQNISSEIPRSSAAVEKSEPEKEPVAADRVETEAKSFSHDIDFASLSDGQRNFFTPQMINNGVLKIDGIYPSARAWKEKYGNGKRNAIPISKNAIQNFSFSIVFYPRSGGQYGFHRNYPIFVLSRSMRYFALMMPDCKLGVALNNFDVKFDTGFEVEPDRWHACQVSLSVPEKRIEVIFDGKVKRFDLTPDFSFRTSMHSVAMESFCFTNYSAGRTFYGDFRHIRIYERTLSFDELRTLSGDIAAKFMIGKYAAANVKKVQDETTPEQLVAQYSRADEIEKKRISSQIASIIIMQLRMKLDDDVDSCIKLLEKCKNIKHSRSDDGWQVVVETIQDAYIKAIKNHDNRRVAKIYEVWKAVDPVPAKNIHRMYTAFIREFLRFNLVEAQNVLNRHKKYSAKYLSPLKEMLDETKKIMNWKLLNSAYADNTSELKAVLHELELIGGSKSDADTVERNVRKRKKLDGSMSRAEMRKQLFRAVANGELWRARMAIDAGAGRHEKEVLNVVFSNGRHGRRNGSRTVWQRLMPKLNSQSGIDRQIMIGILLLIMDNERLTAREMKELEHIKELAGFVYQK